MEDFRRDGEWTRVIYRRGRRQRKERSPLPYYDSHAGYFESDYPQQDAKRVHASLTSGRPRQGRAQQDHDRFYARYRPRRLHSSDRQARPRSGYADASHRSGPEDVHRFGPRSSRIQTGVAPTPRPSAPEHIGGARSSLDAAHPRKDRRIKRSSRPQQERTAPRSRIESQDPDFTPKVRVIFKVIKAMHHLRNISGPDTPPSIRKTRQNLAKLIKPAAPTPSTLALLEEAAKNWEHTAMFILKQHYEDSINCYIQELLDFSTREWLDPFEIATLWARKNLGRRLSQKTLDQTESFLWTSLQEQTTDSAPTCTPAPAPDVTVAALRAAPVLPAPAADVVSAASPSCASTSSTTSTTIRAQVHSRAIPPTPAREAPPSSSSRVSRASVGTMTDRRENDPASLTAPEVEEFFFSSPSLPLLLPPLPLSPSPPPPSSSSSPPLLIQMQLRPRRARSTVAEIHNTPLMEIHNSRAPAAATTKRDFSGPLEYAEDTGLSEEETLSYLTDPNSDPEFRFSNSNTYTLLPSHRKKGLQRRPQHRSLNAGPSARPGAGPDPAL